MTFFPLRFTCYGLACSRNSIGRGDKTLLKKLNSEKGHEPNYSPANMQRKIKFKSLFPFSEIQLVVYYQFCLLIG